MYRLFDAAIRPLLDAVEPSSIIEVGSDNGYSTQLLAEWCRDAGALLHSIDPLPKYDVESWKARWGDVITFHAALSLQALTDIGHADVVLIDGDHNWYTVFHELEMIGRNASAARMPYPLVLLHDVGWPYGRRDLYYDPTTIPQDYVHPHRRGGLTPNEPGLLDRGFNDHLENAEQEGTPRNGVLTAAEDFVRDSDFDLELKTIPGLHGLGIIADAAMIESLGAAWEDLLTAPGLFRVLEAVEKDRLEHLQQVATLQARRTELLGQRRERDLEIARLTRDLAEVQRRFSVFRSRRSVRVAVKAAAMARGVRAVPQRVRTASMRSSARSSTRSGDTSTSGKEGSRGRLSRVRARSRSSVALPAGTFSRAMEQVLSSEDSAAFVELWRASERRVHDLVDPMAGSAGPLVSIVMPTYNRAAILPDAIATVLDQSYEHWELIVCDDASEDDTEQIVRSLDDDRIIYRKLTKVGAAGARNAGLDAARGSLIAYLDSDNLWHPHLLRVLVSAMVDNPGRYAAYCKYVDVVLTGEEIELKKFDSLPFDYERLSDKNYIDLNGFIHRRLLYERFGGFNHALIRQQDWDLILKYSFLRDPLYIDAFLVLYRRNKDWKQITTTQRRDRTSPELIRSSVDRYHREGLPVEERFETPSFTVVSWDVCRNHFSKAYNIVEAMDGAAQAQLLGFTFFDEPVFPPYSAAQPSFDTMYLPGEAFPSWSAHLARAVANVRGDVVYAVKPRLPSLGVALLANYHFGTSVVLEMNDLESVVTRPKPGAAAASLSLAEVDPADPGLRNPYGQLWTEIMESLARKVPIRVTHNSVLDEHFGGGAFFLRNPKDERYFDPARYDRDAVRQELGIDPKDRVLLFGGMVRRHKGVFQLLRFLEKAGPEYRLLVVGSRETPDQRQLEADAGGRVRLVEPVDRNGMARINLASDAVVLWLDPRVPASYYQMPFKLTDAFAMKVPVIANPIGDLAELGRQGYLSAVPFGETGQLGVALDGLFSDDAARTAMVESARRLYLRQFSYSAVRGNLPLILRSAADQGVLPVAEELAAFMASFYAAQGIADTDQRIAPTP
jgi:glycosyltransferase involved in cell wall biosynthesis